MSLRHIPRQWVTGEVELLNIDSKQKIKMENHKAAHVRHRGLDLILVPFDSSFNYKPQSEKHQIVMDLQIAAKFEGISGTVVPVWLKERKLRFSAPADWYPLLRGLTWNDIVSNLNTELAISE